MPIDTYAGTSASRGGWPEIEPSLLEDGQPRVPSFPLDVLPQPWRGWVADTAHGAGAAEDYVAQALLSAVAGLCGAGVRTQVTSAWSEPLVLWQALVGAPSSGRTSALETIRQPLATVEKLLQRDGGARRTVIADAAFAALAGAVKASPTGVLLWRDDPSAWLAGLGRDRTRWRRLAEAKPAREDEAVTMLHRLAVAVGTPEKPLVLALEEEAVKAFDRFLVGLYDEVRRTEGLQAGWLGRGRGTIPRLAAALALLAWAERAGARPPRAIGRDQLQAATRLWRDYFWPHARAVFDRGAPTTQDRQTRRVIHWLQARKASEVSREDIRRSALCQSVTAAAADQVIYRLEAAGILRGLRDEPFSHNGRPARRWQVNPALVLPVKAASGVAESAETPSDADADDISATPSPALSG